MSVLLKIMHDLIPPQSQKFILHSIQSGRLASEEEIRDGEDRNDVGRLRDEYYEGFTWPISANMNINFIEI